MRMRRFETSREDPLRRNSSHEIASGNSSNTPAAPSLRRSRMADHCSLEIGFESTCSRPDAHHRREVGDARIALQLGDHRLDLGHVVREVVEIVDAAVEQPVALEEFAAARNEDVAELVRSARGGVRPSGRRRRGPAPASPHRSPRGGRCSGWGRASANSSRARRDGRSSSSRLDVVGVDPEARDGVDEQEQREEQDRRHHPAGVCEHELDPSGEEPPDHIVESPFHELLSYSDASMRSCERGAAAVVTGGAQLRERLQCPEPQVSAGARAIARRPGPFARTVRIA